METDYLKRNIVSTINKSTTIENSLQLICNFLKQEISYYEWVGFYFKNGENIGQIDIDSHTINPFSKKDE